MKLNDGKIDSLATAQALAADGLRVLPARHQQKAPLVKWREYQDIPTDKMLPQWFGGTSPRNYWVMTGRNSNAVVVDCDNAAAEAWWREKLGDELMDGAGRVKTRKGHHYWFKIPDTWNPDAGVASWSVHAENGPSFDVRADDTGVIVPPSTHESGHIYTWEKPFAEAVDAPPGLLDGTIRAQAPQTAATSGEGTRKAANGQVRSMLSSLLAAPPQEGGRNDWLTRVAGHYAKTYHNQEDLFLQHVADANSKLTPPLTKDEFDKTVQSVWRGEHERNPERALDWECGYLQSGGTNIITQVVVKGEDDSKQFDVAEFADFDLRAKGVMVGEDDVRVYWVQIVKRARGRGAEHATIDAILPATVCGDDKTLRKWLAGYACTIIPPFNMWPKEGSVGVRIQRYIEAQHPPEVKVTRTLGWDPAIIGGEGGFVTHDGIITADEVFTCEAAGVRPDPALLVGKMAPHVYGFEKDPSEAKRVLREVLTFHHDEVTSIFGAWWAACLVKPQIEAKTSLFPFLAIEAPSESGKTNGFFDMMTQLNGNTRGETQPTKAALRDMAAAHRNGIVWVDDLDDPTYLMELLRAATSGGSLTKMGEDRESVKNTQIVAPVVISGEALGLGTQKALLDRAVIVKATSPTGRRSVRDSDRAQWDDVLDLRSQYPAGLSTVAGWLVQDALAVQDRVVAALRAARGGGAGRAGDKVAVLRVGARLLDYLVAEDGEGEEAAFGPAGGRHLAQVERWIEADASEGIGSDENTLTLMVLPWAIRTFGYPEKAIAGTDRTLDTPAYVKNRDRSVARSVQQLLGGDAVMADGPEIWFNTALLAQAFEREKHGRVERRTQTETALKDQADALGAPAKRVRIGNSGRLAYYRKIDGDLAARVMARAQGA